MACGTEEEGASVLVEVKWEVSGIVEWEEEGVEEVEEEEGNSGRTKRGSWWNDFAGLKRAGPRSLRPFVVVAGGGGGGASLDLGSVMEGWSVRPFLPFFCCLPFPPLPSLPSLALAFSSSFTGGTASDSANVNI